jgi:hypothetical protein
MGGYRLEVVGCPRRPGLRLVYRPARRSPLLSSQFSPSGTSDVSSEYVGCVPVETAAGAAISHSGARIGVGGGFLHVAQRDPGIQRRGNERVSQSVRPNRLLIPARWATRRTIRAAPCRSSRRPSEARKSGPSLRSPAARSIARAVRGASGTVTALPPLRVTTKVRCPRSTPRDSMLAPVASETRSPFRAPNQGPKGSWGSRRPRLSCHLRRGPSRSLPRESRARSRGDRRSRLRGSTCGRRCR